MPFPRSIRVRWIILSILVGFAFFAYVQRTGISVVAAPIMSEGGVTQIQIGWALTAFLISYTVFQLPGGVFGEWLGSRRAFMIMTLLAAVATLAIAGGSFAFRRDALFMVILCACLLLGIAQSPIFAVSAGVIETWFPSRRWGTAQGIDTAAAQIGSAVAAPLTAWLVQTLGWKTALVLPTVPAVALTAFWAWYARDNPAQHPSLSAAESEELCAERDRECDRKVRLSDVWRVLSDRNILLLSTSYLCMNFVFYLLSFWSFLYLVQQRHFSILEGGWLASIPYAGAAIGGVAGGVVCDRLCSRWGARIGYRAIPLVALPVGGLLLLVAVQAVNAYWAVAALAFAYASIELTEGPFIAAATYIARQHTMAATAVINTGGNLGGIIATPIVAFLSAKQGWTAAFVTGAAFAAFSAVLWLGIDSSRPLAKPVEMLEIDVPNIA